MFKKLVLSLSVVGIITTSLFGVDSAETIIEKNNCMSCHNIMGMKDAPPFMGISWRNSRMSSDAKTIIENSIKNGSQGKYPMFSNIKMPAFSHFSDEELDTLSTWILSQSKNSNKGMMNRCGMGKCGGGMSRCGSAN